MASQQVANYSNSTAALRSTITGQMQQIGDDREDDMKAFQAEILSQSSMFAKEKFIEKGPTALRLKLVPMQRGSLLKLQDLLEVFKVMWLN